MSKGKLALEIDLDEVERFFSFFDRYCNHEKGQFWMISAHPRKANGERGANILPELKNVRLDKVIGGAAGMRQYIRRIHGYMLAIDKMADLHIRESPEVEIYYRTLFIDDLELYFLEQLAEDYPGPIAAIETSQDNYQAMLIAPRLPIDATRTRFRGLFREEVKRIQQALARRYWGDPGSVSANQPRRFAQSPNYKGCARGEKPFYARTAMLRGETGTAIDGERFLIEALNAEGGFALSTTAQCGPSGQSLPGPGTASRALLANGGGRDESRSGEAFRHSLRQLLRGVPPARVEGEVAARWGAGRAVDWPRRTVHNAGHLLGLVADSYSSTRKV